MSGSVESRVISVVSMSTDDSVICGNVWLPCAVEEPALGEAAPGSHLGVLADF